MPKPKVGRILSDAQGGLRCQILLDTSQAVFVHHDRGNLPEGLLTIELSRFMGFASHRILTCNLDSPAGQSVLAILTRGTDIGSLPSTPMGAAIAFVTAAKTVAELKTRCAVLVERAHSRRLNGHGGDTPGGSAGAGATLG